MIYAPQSETIATETKSLDFRCVMSILLTQRFLDTCFLLLKLVCVLIRDLDSRS